MEEWLIIVVRTLLLFFLILLVIPLLGRRPVSGMTTFDYVVGLAGATMIALIALNLIPNLGHGLVALFLWFLAIIFVQFFAQKSKWIHDHIYGKEIVVVKQGKIMEENLHSARLTGEELLSQLRRKNIFHLADVEFAVMEANGDITTLLKREKQPITPKDMSIQVNPMQEPQTVILDGKLLDEPLTTLGLNRDWLLNELDKMGLSAENIFIAQVDSMGELYIDLFDDTLQQPISTSKQLLFSTLKKVEADFLSYSLETEDQEWKGKYAAHAQEMKQIYERLAPYLTK